MPNTDGHPLTLFAAIPHAGIECHVVAKAADLLKGGGAIADQGGALHRRTDLAILHPVGLGAGEDELAIGDVYLTAAKADGPDTIRHVPDEIFGGCVTAQHIRVGHSRHRRMCKALASTVAGGFDSHQAGVLAILHVADQYTVLDQRGFLAGRALVINGDGTAAVRDRAIVQHGDTGEAMRLPNSPAKADDPLRLKSPSSP